MQVDQEPKNKKLKTLVSTPTPNKEQFNPNSISPRKGKDTTGNNDSKINDNGSIITSPIDYTTMQTPQMAKVLDTEAASAIKLSQPRKLVLGSPEHRFAFSQSVKMPSTEVTLPSGQVPNLREDSLPPLTQTDGLEERGRRSIMKVYTQSLPKSPNRSPTRTLELIKLSPTKKSRLELQRLYDAQRAKTFKKERLFIHQLVLNNFKSYAGSQVIGPFDPSFSAVVGPNGSGKSNVIDSMLFVFGFRANKMRQDRLSDLIHKSEQFPNLNSCSVEVYFRYAVDKEGKNTEIVPDKELIVERKAFKNNSSKYFIDRRESNYTEVTKRLREEGIDLDHKRFLILQGEVENIAQMKPKAEKESDDGLLEYLEDIIGTAKYKPLIEENTIKIEQLNDVCIEKKNRFDFVAKEKESLESDKDKALEFIEREKQLVIEKATMTQYELYQNNQKIHSTLTKLNEFNHDINKRKLENNALLESKTTIVNELEALKHKLDNLKNEIKKLTNQNREFNTIKVSNEEILKNITKKKEMTRNAIEKSQFSIQETENKLTDLEHLQNEYDKELVQLQNTIINEKAILNDIKLSLKDKTESISKKINKLEKDLEPWNAEIQKKKSDIKLTEMDITLINESKTKFENHINSIKESIEKLKVSLSEKDNTIIMLDKQHKKILRDIKIGKEECLNAKNKLYKMGKIINTQHQQAQEARSTLLNVENRSKILIELTKLQQSGKISGFHGRLGDLGVIDDKYDTAVSTACPRLNDLVVETVECGQYCLDFIKKNKLGFTRFILLDKISHNIKKISTPENTPRLFDLITPKEPKFAAAFFNVMGNTLVANDLKQANRVAYGKKRFRVVTLDGKLIDISGAMTGGGSVVASSLLQLKSKKSNHEPIFTEFEVSKMEESLKEKEKSYDIAKEMFQEMELELSKLEEKEPQLDIDIAKLKIDVESIRSDIDSKETELQKKLKEKDSMQNDKGQLDKLHAKVKSLNDEINNIMERCKSTNEKVSELKDEIMKIGGSKLQMQNSKVDSILERINILEERKKKERNNLKKLASVLKRHKRMYETSVVELEKYEKDSEEAHMLIDNATGKLQEIDDSLNVLESQKDDLNSEIDNKSQQLQELEKDLNDFKLYELEMSNKTEKLNALLKALQKTVTKLTNELSGYKLRDVSAILKLLESDAQDKSISIVDNKTETDKHDSSVVAESFSESDDMSENDVSSMNNNLNSDKMDVDHEDKEISRGIPSLSEETLEKLNVSLQHQKIEELQTYVDTTNVNVEVLEEYARRTLEYNNREKDLNEAIQRREDISVKLEDLKKERFGKFMEGFGIISMTLKEMYQMITMGGNAELELVDSLDPFSEGVTFSVMPPKKSWRNITNLSGGEKTLSSLALVFALHKYKPTPLYVMDEIDAALDFRNVSIVANYITERTKNAQFVVISLRNNMFELAKNLVGIYKYENMSKSATMKNNGAHAN